LHDDAKVELWDLSSNFFLSETDVGQNRAQACVLKLQELNNAVIISTLTGDLAKEQLSNFQVHSRDRRCLTSLFFGQIFD
jgi:ubiquitin-activating enzyme E1